MKLMSFILPDRDFCTHESMYYRGGYVVRDRDTLIIEKGYHNLSFDTYFNSFSHTTFLENTNVKKIKFCFELFGECDIRVFNAYLFGKDIKEDQIGFIQNKVSQKTLVKIEIDLNKIKRRGFIYPQIRSLEKECTFFSGYIETDEEVKNNIDLGIVICTYKREKYVMKNTARILDFLKQRNDLANKIKIFVIDNGNTLSGINGINIIPNKNYGGSGGFTRGIIETKNRGCSHFLLMDDDIVFEPEIISRTISILEHLTNFEKTTIGGAMLLLDKNNIQYEMGSKWTESNMSPCRRNVDLTSKIELVNNEEPLNADFTAWWYCCMPTSTVDRINLPLPFFIKFDDVEYSLRAKNKIILCNGIGVWHEGFKSKYSGELEYYTFRNKAILRNLYDSGWDEEKTIELLKSAVNIQLRLQRYNVAEIIIRAFEDFLKGADFLKSVEADKLHIDLRKNNPKQIKEIELKDKGFDIAKLLLGQKNRSNRTKDPFVIDVHSGKISDEIRKKSLIHYNFESKEVFLTNFSKKNEENITERLEKVCTLIRTNFKEACKSFKNGFSEITSMANWMRILEIPKDDKVKTILPNSFKHKVLFAASDNDFSSGAFRSLVYLCKNLSTKFGVNPLVVLPCEGDGEFLLDANNIKYTYIDSSDWIIKVKDEKNTTIRADKAKQLEANINAIAKLEALIKREKVDIVHINTSYTYVMAEAAIRCGVPYVWHLREYLEEDQGRQFYDKKKAIDLISKAAKIITISKSLYNKYQGVLSKNKMSVIHNGIEPEKFYNDKKIIFQNEIVKMAFIGVLTTNKGYEVLLSALALLFKKGFSNFELSLVGGCEEKTSEKINNYCKENGIEDKVKLLGRVNEPQKIYKDNDITFMCSKLEAFGRVTVEAMLAGNLVIGANTGGTIEIIKDKQTGLIYEQTSPEDLCNKILYAINNKNEMISIAAKGREIAKESFSAERNARDIAGIYDELVFKPEVAAIVVTYNRKDVLRECLDALINQDYKNMNIYVVDNASTDGTGDTVSAYSNPKIKYINTGSNIGGAGGFYVGVKAAYEAGAKWIWLMDDDVIPSSDALSKLLTASDIVKGKKSFFASSVYSDEGKPMNTPVIDARGFGNYPFWYKYLDKGIVKINTATFVSILVNSYAIEKCGLPCKDFFIWGDDTEYTKRLSFHYGPAYMVGDSKVIHKRAITKPLTIDTESNTNRIKFYSYMVRNTLIYMYEYDGEKAAVEFLNHYLEKIRLLKKSEDPLRREKIDAITKGIMDYKNKEYDYNAFKNRFNVDCVYQTKNKEIASKKPLNKVFRVVAWPIRMLFKFIIFSRKYGIKYACEKAKDKLIWLKLKISKKSK